jgi:hypothetical protein
MSPAKSTTTPGRGADRAGVRCSQADCRTGTRRIARASHRGSRRSRRAAVCRADARPTAPRRARNGRRAAQQTTALGCPEAAAAFLQRARVMGSGGPGHRCATTSAHLADNRDAERGACDRRQPDRSPWSPSARSGDCSMLSPRRIGARCGCAVRASARCRMQAHPSPGRPRHHLNLQ